MASDQALLLHCLHFSDYALQYSYEMITGFLRGTAT